jgi:hypothetical protein
MPKSFPLSTVSKRLAVFRRGQTLLVLPLEIPVVEVSNEQKRNHSCSSKSGRDVVTRHDVRLLVGREGENWYPSGENEGESIHLRQGSVMALARKGE